jgi:hypothetical protein
VRLANPFPEATFGMFARGCDHDMSEKCKMICAKNEVMYSLRHVC